MLALFCCVLAGYLRMEVIKPVHDPCHLLWQEPGSCFAYQGVVERVRQKEQADELVVKLSHGQSKEGWRPVHGKVVIWLPSGGRRGPPPAAEGIPRAGRPMPAEPSSPAGWQAGSVIQVTGRAERLLSSSIPGLGPPSSYWEKQQVYHRLVAGKGALPFVLKPPPGWRVLLLRWREGWRARLHTGSEQSTALLAALLLGEQGALSAASRHRYAQAGIAHLLATSGMHLAILLWLLCLLLGFFARLGLPTWLANLLAHLVLWGYACMAGASPSLLRATTTFTLLHIGGYTGRRLSRTNLLAGAALLWLWYDPLLCLDVSFQLSYLASWGLASLYPWLACHLPAKRKLPMRWFSEKLLTHLSVQLATLPAVLYHFHHVPLYGFLGDMVGTPLAGCLLVLGCLQGSIGHIHPVRVVLERLLAGGAELLTGWVAAIAAIPYGWWGPCSVKGIDLVCYCWLAGALAAFWWQRRYRYWLLFCLGMASWASYRIATRAISLPTGLLVHELPGRRAGLVLVKEGTALLLASSPPDRPGSPFHHRLASILSSLDAPHLQMLSWEEVATLPRQPAWLTYKEGLGRCTWQGDKIAWVGAATPVHALPGKPYPIDLLVADRCSPAQLRVWLRYYAPRQVVYVGYLSEKVWRQWQARPPAPLHVTSRQGCWYRPVSRGEGVAPLPLSPVRHRSPTLL